MGRGDGQCWRCRDPHPAGERVVWADVEVDSGVTLFRPLCSLCATDWAGDVSSLATTPCDICGRPVAYTAGTGKGSSVRGAGNVCSFGCRTALQASRPPTLEVRICENCGQTFLTLSAGKGPRYCGALCRQLVRQAPTPEEIVASLSRSPSELLLEALERHVYPAAREDS